MTMRRNWSKELIISEIKKYDIPTAIHVPQSLYLAGMRFFGSWRDAVLSAGYDFDAVSKEVMNARGDPWNKGLKYSRPTYNKTDGYIRWTKNSTIYAISHCYSHGLSISYQQMVNEDRGDIVEAGRKLFGSWNLALEAAGVDPKTVWLTHLREITEPPKTPEYAYFLGVLFGDGTISGKSVVCTATDIEMVNLFADIGEKSFSISPSRYVFPPSEKYRRVKVQYSARFSSVRMNEYLRVETHNKKIIPQWIIYGNDSIIGAFIRGFADAEGDISNKHAQIGITQKNRDILVVINDMLSRLGVRGTVYLKDKKAMCHAIRISHLSNVKRYAEVVGFAIKRKAERLLRWQETPINNRHLAWDRRYALA